MNYINCFIVNIDKFLNELGFSPLVLIGLLITSLSLILTLKNTNIYIAKYKKQDNIISFINRIYKTAGALIFLFILSFINKFFNIESIIFNNNSIIYFVISLFVIALVSIIVWNLILITYTIKKIVTTSLK